jgi:hypothetical protein
VNKTSVKPHCANDYTCWFLLQMKDDALDGNKAAAEAAAQRGNMLMTALWSIVGGGRAAESAGRI